MVEEADALARILAAAEPLEPVELPLLEALGFFLPKPVRSVLAHPRFDNSVVDGYALRVEDSGTERQIVGEQPAGRDRALSLGAHEAIRIFTGAPIPAHCTGVIMQEDVRVEGQRLILQETLDQGENIRPAGADLAAGQLIGRAGERVTPQLIGLLASQGLATASVHRTPTVTVLSTGDELRPPGTKLAAGETFNSNSLMLAALLRPLGIDAELRHSPDDRSIIEAEIHRALEQSDVLIISGGVSVGDHDHVRPALKACGVALDLWRIRMKPGKPLAFARAGKKLIFGLPGNPVAAFVTFQVLLRPALLQMLGAQDEERFLPQKPVRLESALSNPGDRPHYLRGRVENGLFVSHGLQESHALYGLSQSKALLRLEAGESLAAGSERFALTW
ncbi:MAG TPA: gephyrin-like molybdotransferase Glp [Chthoniobacterales bacterium]|jgi:molybdopterin molybdotransferase